MTVVPWAMVLAAGEGRRMAPLSDHCPKPLLEVAGRSLLDRTLDHLLAYGCALIVVNSHKWGEMLRAHLERRWSSSPHVCARLMMSPEPERLDSGGGVQMAYSLAKKVLTPEQAAQPFFVANADILWQDGAGISALRRCAELWDARMEALLLLQPRTRALGYAGAGDFAGPFTPGDAAPGDAAHDAPGDAPHDAACWPLSWPPRPPAPYVFTGLQLIAPRLLEPCHLGAFPLHRLYARAAERRGLYGLRHGGAWMHVGTPQALAEAQDLRHLSAFGG